MLAFLLQLSAEQSILIGLAIVAALVLLLGLAGEYAEHLLQHSDQESKPDTRA
jgi:hypothetical protein